MPRTFLTSFELSTAHSFLPSFSCCSIRESAFASVSLRVMVHLRVFLESDLCRDLAEALPAHVDAILVDVRPVSAAAPARLQAQAAAPLIWRVVLQVFLELDWLVPQLPEHFLVIAGRHSPTVMPYASCRNPMASSFVIVCLCPTFACLTLLRLTLNPGRSRVRHTWRPMMPILGSYLMSGISMYSWMPKAMLPELSKQSGFSFLSFASMSRFASISAAPFRSVSLQPRGRPGRTPQAGILLFVIVFTGSMPVRDFRSRTALSSLFWSFPVPMFRVSFSILMRLMGFMLPR